MIYRILSQDSTFRLIKILPRSQALITNMEKEFRRVEQSLPQHNDNVEKSLRGMTVGLSSDVVAMRVITV